jgi:hypothetical protein
MEIVILNKINQICWGVLQGSSECMEKRRRVAALLKNLNLDMRREEFNAISARFAIANQNHTGISYSL